MRPPMQTKSLADTLKIQYRYTGYTFLTTLDGLTEEQALNQPGTEGHCINWVAGHLLQTRGATLVVLGQDLPFAPDKYDRYKRATDPITSSESTTSLAEIIADFSATKEPLLTALKSMTQEKADSPAPFSPFKNENETLGSLLAGLFFHESYHVGQLGILRRMAGAEGVIK